MFTLRKLSLALAITGLLFPVAFAAAYLAITRQRQHHQQLATHKRAEHVSDRQAGEDAHRLRRCVGSHRP